MTIPASRFSDAHVCSKHLSDGPVLGPGAPEVFVAGLPAARLTDQCICGVAQLSPIAEGAAMVLFHGLPAARIGVKTLEGGVLIAGDASVLIGGATFSLPSFITIEGDAAYQAKVIRDLYKISSTESGQRLLASMAKKGGHVRIHPPLPGEGNNTLTDPPLEKPVDGDKNRPEAYNGTGTDSQISYDPDKTDMGPGYDQKPDSAWAHPPNYSPDVSLFHEMVHSDDMMYGRADKTMHNNAGRLDSPFFLTKEGELRAAGLTSSNSKDYSDTSKYPYSENTYRKERGLRPREYY